jgi:hypothetical protein
MTLRNEAVMLRWFDARYSLLLPQEAQSHILIPGFAALSPALADYFAPAVLAESLTLRPTDQDRPLNVYQVNGLALAAELGGRFDHARGKTAGPIRFGDVIEFLGYDLQTPAVAPGEEVRLATLWRVKRPLADTVLFTQVLGPDGIIAQADRLDVPGDTWHPGDVFVQLHQFKTPKDTAVGSYPVIIGLYTASNKERLPVFIESTTTGNDTLLLQPLVVTVSP